MKPEAPAKLMIDHRAHMRVEATRHNLNGNGDNDKSSNPGENGEERRTQYPDE